jgi:hypothetical protein
MMEKEENRFVKFHNKSDMEKLWYFTLLKAVSEKEKCETYFSK